MQKRDPNTIKKEFALEVAQEAVRLYKQQEEKIIKSRIFRNTKRLLNHYRELNDHIENAVWSFSQDDEPDYSSMMSDIDEDVFIESIKRSAARTVIIVSHVDKGLSVLKMKTSKDLYKYTVIDLMYISTELAELSMAERLSQIAERLTVSEATVRRYELDMTNKLSVLLFGAGAVNLEIQGF